MTWRIAAIAVVLFATALAGCTDASKDSCRYCGEPCAGDASPATGIGEGAPDVAADCGSIPELDTRFLHMQNCTQGDAFFGYPEAVVQEDVPPPYEPADFFVAEPVAWLSAQYSTCAGVSYAGWNATDVQMYVVLVLIGTPEAGRTNTTQDFYVLEWITDHTGMLEALGDHGFPAIHGDFSGSSVQVGKDECQIRVSVEGKRWYAFDCMPQPQGPPGIGRQFYSGFHALDDTNLSALYWTGDTRDVDEERQPRIGTFTEINDGALSRYPGAPSATMDVWLMKENLLEFTQLLEE